jgi:hypothetical protein
VVYNLLRRQICGINTIHCCRIYNDEIHGSSNGKEPLPGVVAFDAWVRILIHSTPMLQVKCPISHDVGPQPSPCCPWTYPLDHTPLIPHTYVRHKSATDDVGTSELFFIQISSNIPSNNHSDTKASNAQHLVLVKNFLLQNSRITSYAQWTHGLFLSCGVSRKHTHSTVTTLCINRTH